MKLFKFITPSDPITFYAPDSDIAEAVTIFVGNGKAGLRACDENDTPDTMIVFAGFGEGQLNRYKETMKQRSGEVVAAGKTFAVCTAGFREEYDELTKNSTNIKRIRKWDDKHRTSISDWCKYARNLKLAKTEKE